MNRQEGAGGAPPAPSADEHSTKSRQSPAGGYGSPWLLIALIAAASVVVVLIVILAAVDSWVWLAITLAVHATLTAAVVARTLWLATHSRER